MSFPEFIRERSRIEKVRFLEEGKIEVSSEARIQREFTEGAAKNYFRLVTTQLGAFCLIINPFLSIRVCLFFEHFQHDFGCQNPSF